MDAPGYDKSFDQLRSEVLTDYVNVGQESGVAVDISIGTDVYRKAAVTTSALWGAYRYLAYVRRQIFPQTCDSQNLTVHAANHGIVRAAGESDSSLLQRLLAWLRFGSAGGNKKDYERWARETTFTHTLQSVPVFALNYDYVAGDVVQPTTPNGHIYMCTQPGRETFEPPWSTDPGGFSYYGTMWREWALVDDTTTFIEAVARVAVFGGQRGPGTIDIIVQSDYDRVGISANKHLYRTPSTLLLQAIRNKVEDLRGVTQYDYRVLRAVDLECEISVSIPEPSTDARARVAADIESVVRNLPICRRLSIATIMAVCVQDGYDSPNVSYPMADIVPWPDTNEHFADYQRVWPYLGGVGSLLIAITDNS